MTRWLVTGAGGQLGSDLVAALTAAPGEQVRALTRADLDIASVRDVDAAVSDFGPDVVINAAAYTAVDAAESDEDAAYRVNATGPTVLAATLAKLGGRLLHVSTDYVFPGDAAAPYEVDSVTGPRSAYGRTKLSGEEGVLALLPDAAYIVRTAWVYGAKGANFVKTMVGLEASHETVSVVDDQRGSPTWSADLAKGLIELGRSTAAPGIYHCTNSGDTTWYDLTREIFTELGADPARVTPTTTAAYPRPAPRPAYSVLSGAAWAKAGLTPLRPWRAALGAAFAEVGEALRPARTGPQPTER